MRFAGTEGTHSVGAVSPEAILSEIVESVLELPALIDDPRWDSYSTAVEVTDDSVAASAFRYTTDGPPVPSPSPRDLGAFRRLRDSMANELSPPWAVCILKIQRDTARATLNLVYPEHAALWRLSPSTYGRIAEALRPVAADFIRDG
jgi:hypothetical protein